MSLFCSLAGTAVFFSFSASASASASVSLSEVPFATLESNLKTLMTKHSRSPRFETMLGQLYANFYATGRTTFPAEPQQVLGGESLMIPAFHEKRFPLTAKTKTPNSKWLDLAAGLFDSALKKNPSYALAQLGQGWVRLQKGEPQGKKLLLALITQKSAMELKMPSGSSRYWSFSLEAIEHVLPLLSRQEASERASLLSIKSRLEDIPVRTK